MSIAELPHIYRRKVKRWDKSEYNTLVDRGMFERQRLYLYRGELISVPPMGALHARTISRLTVWLCSVFASDFEIRIQSPFETPGDSMPEPDGAVVTDEQMSHFPHPKQAVLLVEVSDSSSDLDHEKVFDYAAAGVPEYWIIDVIAKSVEVYRDPTSDASAPTGFRYASREVVPEDGTLASLARPDMPVAVKTLLASA